MRKRNHQIIVRLDDEELLMLKGAADEKLDLCKEGNRCTLMKNGLER